MDDLIDFLKNQDKQFNRQKNNIAKNTYTNQILYACKIMQDLDEF